MRELMLLSDFKNEVQKVANNHEFHLYQHNLNTVTTRYMVRYIETVTKGFDMTNAYYYLCKGQRLPDFNYFRYLRYAYLLYTRDKEPDTKRRKVLVINLL